MVGIDGTNVGLEAVKHGEMVGTVYNDKEGQAKGCWNFLFSCHGRKSGGSESGGWKIHKNALCKSRTG